MRHKLPRSLRKRVCGGAPVGADGTSPVDQISELLMLCRRIQRRSNFGADSQAGGPVRNRDGEPAAEIGPEGGAQLGAGLCQADEAIAAVPPAPVE